MFLNGVTKTDELFGDEVGFHVPEVSPASCYTKDNKLGAIVIKIKTLQKWPVADDLFFKFRIINKFHLPTQPHGFAYHT